MNIKKLFAVLAGVSMLATQLIPAGALAATYSQELQDAYNWAYSKSITTMSSIDNANMYGAITRAELAKMLANWAKDKGQTPDTSKACSFTDTASVQGDLATAIVEACQLGLMGQGITAFRPYDTISRAEFGTALSRALWGSQYEGGNPYYVNHLNALKAAGIMTQIANAESTKEVRGYVMLMLMRSEGAEGSSSTSDCDDPLVVIACAAESSACPAACREDAKEDEQAAPKSGDLSVSVVANKGANAFLYGGVSDLDTINFKSSEEGVTVTKVTLERYGYSSSDDVLEVRLEDEDGNIIADGKGLNSKDQVTLSINKDYRTLDENDVMTIVLKTAATYTAPAKPGSSIGFKVIDVETSAKNKEVENYSPYLYDLVNYEGSDVTLTYKGKGEAYHVGENSYEVFRFKLKASSTSAALVRGFTVTNRAGSKLDLKEFVENVTVTVNDKDVKNLSYDIKDDEITVAFDEIEIGVKENAIFAMNIELSDDFDEYGDGVQFRLNAATQLKVSEKKTGARVNVAGWNVTPTAEYSFNGSKIALSNTKLGTLNYAADTDDVVVAEGTFDISESLVIAANTIVVTATSSIAKPAAANGAGIEAMRLVIAGEDFDAKCADTASKVTTCTFDKKITIEKGGKFQLVVDLDADAVKDATIDFKIGGQSLFSKTTIGTAGTPATVNGFTYEDSKTDVLASDFVGSITLYNLKVTAAKASLENNLTKYVEFKKDQTTTNVVFDGVYTAKKQDLTLTDVNYTPSLALSNADDSVTLNLYIDDQLVSSTDIASTDAAAVKVNDTTTRVKIAAGESVKVRVEADAYVAAANATPYTYLVELVGEDSDGNQAGVASESTVDMKFVAAGSATVTAAKSSTVRANDVLLRASSLDVAEFRVAASNGNVDLDEFRFELSRGGSAAVCKQAAAVPGAASDPVVACGASPLANAADVTNVGDIYTDVAAVPATALHANDVKVKVAGTNVDSEDITDSGDTIIVSNIDQDEIDEDGISVIISLKGVAVADAYTLTLTKVNSDVKALTFNKNIVPAKLSIEQRDLAGSTEYSFKVEKYESNNTVSNVCFYKGATNLGCVAGEVSDGTTLEIEGTTSVQLIDKITYDVAGTTPVSVTIDKATYNDYFYVEGTYLKVFKAD